MCHTHSEPAHAFSIVCGVGQIALHPDDALIVAGVRGLGGDVERDDAFGAALHKHLDQTATDESHAAGDGAVLGEASEWEGRGVSQGAREHKQNADGIPLASAPWAREGRRAPSRRFS